MKRKRTLISAICAIGILLLVLDSKTAYAGATDGIELCVKVIIPSLLPFFLLCPLLSSSCLGSNAGFLNLLEGICRLPAGTGSLFLIGAIGGYPTGASTINEAYRSGAIDKNTAERMLGFCCNAGPGFIFGVLGNLFKDSWTLWIIWGIHLSCALITGTLLPKRTQTACKIRKGKLLSIPDAINLAVRNMASVCCWVIISRIFINFSKKWLLWLLPNDMQVLAVGLLELTNGCCELSSHPLAGMRFMLASEFLSFGGICVLMQTRSVTRFLGIGMYFPGKVIQSILVFLFSALVQPLLFTAQQMWRPPLLLVVTILSVGVAILLFLHKKQ